MSEDNLTLCLEKNNLLSETRAITEVIYRYAQENDCEAPDIEDDGRKMTVFFNFCSAGSDDLQQLVDELVALGAKIGEMSAYYDSVGEQVIFKVFDDRVMQFESEEVLKEYEQERNEPAPQLVFDYGKPMENRTALIRLKFIDVDSLETVAELFQGVLDEPNEPGLQQFKVGFAELVVSNSHDCRWCAFKWKENERWFHGLEQLIEGLRFVTRKEGDLYLGFDLEGISPPAGVGWEEAIENLVYILADFMAGTKRTWAKFRLEPASEVEWYTYFPGTGDSVFVVDRPVSDTKWPRLNGG